MTSRTTTQQRTFSFIAGLIFLLMALVHLWRVVAGWDVVVDGTAVPMWLSWVAVGLSGILAFFGLRNSTFANKSHSIERIHHV